VTTRRAYFHVQAEADLRQIFEWLAEQAQDVGVAEVFVARVRGRCDEIAALPGTLGQARDDLAAGLRGAPWRRYLVLFRYADGRLEIVRILHGMRDLPNVVTQEPES
jgi:toxin ParE1/3/4